MNVIKVKIDFKQGICHKEGISVITGDYNSTKIEFEFDESAENGTKIFEMKNPSEELVYVDEIVNNEVILVGYKKENGETETYSLFGEEGDYTFEVSLYQDNSKLTSVSDVITANKEEVIVDGEEVQEKITLFDNLMNELNEKIEEANNLNVEANKVGKITSIVITKKDGTQEEVQLEDGKSIEYNWEGTRLGIRQEGESSYAYVDLKGSKGEPGAIKMQIVQVLPQAGQDDTIYLVPLEEPESQENRYAEYLWIDDDWELIGKIGIEVDLTDYATKEYVDNIVGDIESILTRLDIGGGI